MDSQPHHDASPTSKSPPIFSSALILISPTNFGYDKETAEDNVLQKKLSMTPQEIHDVAKAEHDSYVETIVKAGVGVKVFKQPSRDAVDAVFPDWFTVQRGNISSEGVLSVFPMRFETRRKERDNTIIDELKKGCKHFIDISYMEKEGKFLEGKGSLIYDHRNRKIYCCTSDRVSPIALEVYMREINKISAKPWTSVTFLGKDNANKVIYHTDCMLQLLNEHVLVCLDAFKEPGQREMVLDELTNPAKNEHPYKKEHIVNLSFDEVGHMCCNVINVVNNEGDHIILMSKQAYTSYSVAHREELKKHYKLVYCDLKTLEDVGGGSARCLMAEYF